MADTNNFSNVNINRLMSVFTLSLFNSNNAKALQAFFYIVPNAKSIFYINLLESPTQNLNTTKTTRFIHRQTTGKRALQEARENN